MSNHRLQLVWTRVFPILEPVLLEYKNERVRKEVASMANMAYISYLCTLPPMNIPYLPNFCEVQKFAAIEEIVETTHGDVLDGSNHAAHRTRPPRRARPLVSHCC